MSVKIHEHINSTWLRTLNRIVEQPEVEVRGTKSQELFNYSSSFNMAYPLLSVKERDLGYRFVFAEAWWILSGRNDVESIKPYSRTIANFSDDGIWFQGAYGPKLVDQLSYIISCFEKDINTRQAVATIWNRNPRATKDHSCTVAIQWIVRDGRIHCIDTMRSSDIWLGYPYDAFNFTMYTLFIALVLKSRGINVELGNLYLNATSQHLYENNFEKAYRITIQNADMFEYPPLSVDSFINHLHLLDYLDRAKDRDMWEGEWLYDLLPDKGERVENWY